MSRAGRLFATAIALLGWAALGLQTQIDIAINLAQGGSVAAALWRLANYFTILTNLLVATTLTAVALGRWPGGPRPGAAALAGAALYATMLTLLFHFLLGGQHGLTGGRLVADTALHYVVPLLMLGFWLAFAPKAGLRAFHPLLWLSYPLLYCAYALVRGRLTGWYPYPVIDAGRLGFGPALTNIALLLLAYLAAGFGFLWLANRFPQPGATDHPRKRGT